MRKCAIWVGLGFMVVTMAMLMTPAVYYRAQHGFATSQMIRVSRHAIRGALGPLAVGLSLEMLTVVSLATDMLSLSVAAAVATLLLFVGLSYLLPRRDPVQVDEPRSRLLFRMHRGCVSRRTDEPFGKWIIQLWLRNCMRLPPTARILRTGRHWPA